MAEVDRGQIMERHANFINLCGALSISLEFKITKVF